VRELVGGGGDLRFDEVEHRERIAAKLENGRWKMVSAKREFRRAQNAKSAKD
jgi:hypothetical protein